MPLGATIFEVTHEIARDDELAHRLRELRAHRFSDGLADLQRAQVPSARVRVLPPIGVEFELATVLDATSRREVVFEPAVGRNWIEAVGDVDPWADGLGDGQPASDVHPGAEHVLDLV